MTELRKKLNLRQEDVAEKVVIRRKDGKIDRMSRSGYCMYEQDGVSHDIRRLALIAQVLQTTPEYLAFGVTNNNTVEQVEIRDDGRFHTVGKWAIDDDWLYSVFEAEPHELVIWVATNPSEHFDVDDAVIVRKDTRPSARPAEFVFSERGKAKIGLVSKPARKGPLVVQIGDATKAHEVAEGDIEFLGRAIGRMGKIGR
jgi:transcriptional regulator with XRE-family HTH domain